MGGHGGGAAGGAAGGTGGAAGGTTAACSYKLCENFESGSLGALPTGWTAYSGYGNDAMKSVALASDQAHSGSTSLKSSSMVPGEERIQKSLAALGATANKHWGRIFYKVSPRRRSPPAARSFTSRSPRSRGRRRTGSSTPSSNPTAPISGATGSFTDTTEVTSLAFTNNANAKMSS